MSRESTFSPFRGHTSVAGRVDTGRWDNVRGSGRVGRSPLSHSVRSQLGTSVSSFLNPSCLDHHQKFRDGESSRGVMGLRWSAQGRN